MRLHTVWAFVITIQFLLSSCSAEVFAITSQNQSILNNYRVALVSYTADWCFYSRQLAPIFAEASEKFVEQTKKAEVIFGRVDCEAQNALCANLKITKYPTIKMLKYGHVMRKEYRQQRTVEALTQFVQDHAKENITALNCHGNAAKNVMTKHADTRNIIFGVFPKQDTSNKLYQYFRQGAHLERDNCAFVILENVSDSNPHIYFKNIWFNTLEPITLPKTYGFADIQSWISAKCTPVVRELTFANAEEITEEGLPLLILFYNDKSQQLIKRFHEVAAKLTEERKSVNFLTADGNQFSHPLSHMKKTVKDLPLLSIDSFAHMYYHPRPPQEVLNDPKHLVTFIQDLHSGKLHREFHYGPDKPTQATNDHAKTSREDSSSETDPPESVFKKLLPSPRKYTILRDEL